MRSGLLIDLLSIFRTLLMSTAHPFCIIIILKPLTPWLNGIAAITLVIFWMLIGVVLVALLRNNVGLFIFGFFGYIANASDILLAELHAIYHGLHMVTSMGISEFMCYSDSLSTLSVSSTVLPWSFMSMPLSFKTHKGPNHYHLVFCLSHSPGGKLLYRFSS